MRHDCDLACAKTRFSRKIFRGIGLSAAGLSQWSAAVQVVAAPVDELEADATAIQVARLAHAGSELVRVTVNTDAAAAAVPEMIRKLRDLVRRGELGAILYLYSTRLNLGKVRKEENILWSFAPHDLSVLLLLVGALPEWASTNGQHYLQHEIADVTMTCLAFPGKPRAHIFVSWLHPFKEQKLVVIGSKKMAVFDDVVKDGKLKIFDKGIEWKDGQPVIRQTAESTLFFPEMEPLREELAHFVDCVRTRKTPRTDGANGVRVLRVLDACQRSIESGGQPVRL